MSHWSWKAVSEVKSEKTTISNMVPSSPAMSNSSSLTSPPSSPLQSAASERELWELKSAGLLSPEAYEAARAILRPSHHWWRWANRILLFVGSALLLAGVIFFFAYNWARMSSVAKLCLIETGLWACAVGALKSGLDQLTGKVLMLAACVLVGVLLAVFGQVYQTGADAYQNYVLWALLILPWVAITRFGALWIVWLIVTNVAAIFFWLQVQVQDDFNFQFGILPILGLWNTAALAAQQFAVHKRWDWLDQNWIGQSVWLAVVTYFTIPMLIFIAAFGEIDDIGLLLGCGGCVVALVAGQYYFRFVRFNFPAIGVNVLSASIVLLTLIGKVLFEISEQAPTFLLFGVIVLAVSTASAFYMRSLSRSRGHEFSD